MAKLLVQIVFLAMIHATLGLHPRRDGAKRLSAVIDRKPPTHEPTAAKRT
jgi:hypothetical protein